MAFNTTTFAALKAVVQQVLGGDPSTWTTTGQIVNDALSWLVSQHRWFWRIKTTVLSVSATALTSLSRTANVVTASKAGHGLIPGDPVRISGADSSFLGSFTVLSATNSSTFTFGQTGSDAVAAVPGNFVAGYIALPADFVEAESVRGPTPSLWAVHKVSLDQIAQMRQNMTYPTGATYWALSWSPQAATNAASLGRMEIWPTPTDAVPQFLRMTYLRMIPTLVDEAATPDMPAWMSDLVVLAVRAFAESTEEDRSGINWQRLMADLPRYQSRDAMDSGIGTTPRGGLSDPYSISLPAALSVGGLQTP